ncbi:ankyrin-2 ankyrin, partial [Colletotrichum navitas]
MAALLGIDAVCQELLHRGEDVNRQSKLGTPLQCALGGPFLLACHNMSTQKRLNDWLERPSRRTVELLIKSGADCTKGLPNHMHSWKTMGALSLKASEWAGDCELFGLVVRGGAQLYDDDTAVFRSICRKWSKTKDQGMFAMIMSTLDMLSNMAAKNEGESVAYLKAFQKCVSDNTDIDTNLPCSEGISDDMLIQQMWNAIAEDNLDILLERSRSPRCSGILEGETLTRLLHFAATCSSVSCLGHLLTTFVASDEQKDERSQMVLDCAEHESVDVLVCLLKHGCTTTKFNSGRNTIWHLSAGKFTPNSLLRTLFIHIDRTECGRALRIINKDGRTPLAEALFKEQYRNASEIVSLFPGEHDILQSTKPSLCQLLAKIEKAGVLKELHASNMVRLPTTESPLDCLDDSATFEIVNELLRTYTYQRSETGKTPLEQYLETTMLKDYNKEVLVALVKADLAQATENAAHSLWQYTCKMLDKTIAQQHAADAAETLNLVKVMIEHGYLEMYEKANSTSGLKEIRALFSIEKPPGVNGNVSILEDLFIIVLDSTTQRDYLENSGFDVAALKWAILYDSMFLFDNILQGGANVCKREYSLHALEFLCSNGSSPNRHRMLVKMLEKVEKADLNQLTPSGEGLGLLHRLGIPDGRGINLFGCPTFRSTMALTPNLPPPPPPHLGYSRIGTTGFAQARQPLENQKFNLVQRLLLEQVDCQVLSTRSHFSPLSTHISFRHVDTAKLILRHGANQTLHVPDVNGWTPVSWACAYGYVDLLENIAASHCPEPIWDFKVRVTLAAWNFGAKSFKDIRALHLAAIASPDTVVFLLDRGFATNLDVTAADLSTPLHLAAFFGLTDTIKILVSRGCNINAQTSAGLTPLHISLLHQDETTVALLLELGVDHLKTTKGETPLDVAMKRKSKRIIDMVKSSLRRVPTDSTKNET